LRLQDGHERILQRSLTAVRHAVRSSASSIALIGCSGVGKSKSIERILERYDQVFVHDEPFSLHQVVWLKLDCPYVGSPKQLCINFFKEMDLLLGTRYLARHGSSRMSVDEMMVHMAQVANLHALGVLIIDEIQHLRQARGTGPDAMLNFLVTLVNTIGIPVIIIGTLGALPLLQGDFRQARRASGLGSLVWERMAPGRSWDILVERLWNYQWTREYTPLTPEIRQILYEESQGNIDVVVKLVMLAQLRAMQLGVRNRPEILDSGLLRRVAAESFQIIRPMIDALKKNDRATIARYDDIRPLQDHVMQVFGDAQVRLSARPVAPRAMDGAGVQTDQSSDPILGALRGLGVADDVAALMIAAAKAEAPGATPLDLVGLISQRLTAGKVELWPAKPRAARSRTRPGRTPSSIETVVAAGKDAGQSGYQSLLAAGVVRPPLADFPL